MEINHFSHRHPLVLVDQETGTDQSPKHYCSGCEEAVERSTYSCGKCRFFLHKKCAELPGVINHPLHLQHPLVLSGTPYAFSKGFICNLCLGTREGFAYHCSSCKFDLDISCATHPQLVAGDFQKLQHFSHKHPLVFVQNIDFGNKNKVCFGCERGMSSPFYSCPDCLFNLHKKCAELSLEITHPLHHHPLVLSVSPYGHSKGFLCNLCYGLRQGFAYHCSSCKFDLDISCATHPQLVAGDFQKLQHLSHKHPLVFVQNIDFGNKNKVCFGCERGMSSPFYSCPDCTFYLHKKCAELPLKINHPSHRKHPLFCLVQSPPHQEKCSCYLCKKSYKGFVYYCSLCEFGFRAADASLQTITAKIHPEHPLIPFPTTNPLFICNACGIDGYRFSFPYICSECGLMLHEDCVCLSRSIKITRHHHQLSHIYFFQEEEAKERECNICHDEVNVEYGSYCCLKCNYFAHVNCAIDKDLLEEEEEGEVEKSKLSASDDSTGDLSCAFTEIKPGEIKHFAHKHNLIFSDRGVKDGRSCEGCMRPIATSFYYCEECDFFIHEGCAKLLKKVRHWASKHSMELLFHIIFGCTYCRFWNSGFGYRFDENSGFGYRFDENSGFGYIFDEHCYPKTMCIRCHEILDTCTVERHEHPLFFDHKYSGSCCGCDVELMGGFRCKYKKCKFAIDYRCLVLPNTARYKYDNHLLTLTFHDNHHLSQCYCDICEEDRDPNHWFYHCADCDVSAHPDCLLRRSPYVKLGKPFRYAGYHQHPVTFVKIEFNPPKCNKCDKPCRDELAIQCTESNCNYIFHWFCLPDLYLLHAD